jgi:hypothetical protein
MKVSRLIQQLSTLPGDTPVYFQMISAFGSDGVCMLQAQVERVQLIDETHSTGSRVWLHAEPALSEEAADGP